MSGWVIWVVVAAACGIGEMLTGGLYLAPFAIAAVLAAIVDALGAGDFVPWIVFEVVYLM